MTAGRTGVLRGIRFRMAALLVVPIIPLVAIVAWQVSTVRERQHQEAMTDTLRISRLVADNVTSVVLQTRSVLRVAEQLNPATFASPDACAATMAGGAATIPAMLNAFVVTPEGRVWCSLHPIPAGLSLADRAYVVDARDGITESAGVEPAGDLLATPALVVSSPLENGIVLAVALDLGSELGSIVERFALPAGSAVTLVDGTGMVVARWPPMPSVLGSTVPMGQLSGEIMSGSVEGVLEGTGFDGTDRIYSYVDVAGSAGSVFAVVGVPRSWGLGPADRELRTNLILLGVLALVIMVVAVILAERSIIRHLHVIAGTTKRIGAGDLSARVGPRRAASELVELGGAVDQMAADIEARDTALRSASAERARLVDELLDVQEEERRRIAADIHDDTIQAVVSCGMSAQLLRSQVDDPDARQQLDQLVERISNATTRLRRLSFELEPPAADVALADGLEHYVLGALDDGVVQLSVAADVPGELAGPVRQVVFRNIREAVLNAVRHGAAQFVDVTVEERQGGVLATVVDDGTGFVGDAAARPGHRGVRTMSERTEALGGWFSLTSEPDGGARVAFWVPRDVADQLRAYSDGSHAGEQGEFARASN